MLSALADAEWVGDGRSKKSVGGGAILPGKHLVKDGSKEHGGYALPKQNCTLAIVKAQSRLGFGFRQRLGHSCAGSAAHRLLCSAIHHQKNTARTTKAHQDSALVAPRGGAQR